MVVFQEPMILKKQIHIPDIPAFFVSILVAMVHISIGVFLAISVFGENYVCKSDPTPFAKWKPSVMVSFPFLANQTVQPASNLGGLLDTNMFYIINLYKIAEPLYELEATSTIMDESMDETLYMVPCPVLPPPPNGMVPPPPPIPHTFCTRHCSETYISILLHARRCSETRIFILLDEPSRRIRWVDRAKLWRNANFKLQELLRAVHRTLQCSANGIIYIYISMYIHIHKHQ